MPQTPPDPVAGRLPLAAPPAARSIGLVLPGGGARAAYQVGVLKAIAEWLPRDAPVPFRVISGTSAGAIIATLLAGHAGHFRHGVLRLERFWRDFRVEQVYRADAASMLRAGAHWLLALVSGGRLVAPPHAIFDNSPLRALLERHLNFAAVRRALDRGLLDALAVNATSYRSARSVTFYASARDTTPWRHSKRLAVPAALGLDHLMASAAVPFLFPPVYMGGEYYGDGAMRQLAPLSPAINLGADRLLVIGVRAPSSEPLLGNANGSAGPTFGQIFGLMLDTLFMDGVQADLERLQRDNLLIAGAGGSAGGLRRIAALSVTPCEDFGPIAGRHLAAAPPALRTLLRTVGAANPGGRTLLSYLLFEGGYARDLIAIGHADAQRRRDEIQGLLLSEP